MAKRIVFGSILTAVMVGVLLLDWQLERLGWPGADGVCMRGLPLTALLLVLVAAGHRELSGLAAGAGVPMLGLSAMLGAMAVATLPFWRQGLRTGPHGQFLALLVLSAVVTVVFADQVIRHATRDAIRRIGASLLAVCYLGVCGAMTLGIRVQYGLKAFALFVLAVKATDVGAYFVGTAAGRHRLVRRLSPNKSWEGLLGGLALGAAAAAGLVAVADPVLGFPDGSAAKMHVPAAAAFGVIVGLIGQGADLCESALKRDAKRKDAGQALPGFGGVLDLADSPLLAAPAAYVILALLR